MVLLFASQSAHLGLFGAGLVLGVLIATFGHIIHSRPVIIIGIMLIAGISAYFSFVLQPAGG